MKLSLSVALLLLIGCALAVAINKPVDDVEDDDELFDEMPDDLLEKNSVMLDNDDNDDLNDFKGPQKVSPVSMVLQNTFY